MQMGRLASSRTGKMKEYVSRRRNTPRLGKDAREKILAGFRERYGSMIARPPPAGPDRRPDTWRDIE